MDINELGQKFDDYAQIQTDRHIEVVQRLTTIETTQAGLPARVDSLEASRDRSRGATWVFGLLWTGLVAVVGVWARWGKH